MEEKQVNKYKEYRKKLGMTQMKICETLEIPKRTWEKWEQGIQFPAKWTENLLFEKLEKMNDIAKNKSGLKMLDDMQACTIMFTSEEASNLAKLAIKYQLDYYENNPDEAYYNYTPDILKATLKEITPENMAVDKDTLTIKEIINRVEALTTFLY